MRFGPKWIFVRSPDERFESPFLQKYFPNYGQVSGWLRSGSPESLDRILVARGQALVAPSCDIVDYVLQFAPSEEAAVEELWRKYATKS